MKKRYLITAVILTAVILLIGSGIVIKNNVQAQVQELFKLNEELKSAGYYLAEFEFKMLGCAYYLDKGRYFTALSKLNQLHRQMQTREGLIKIPEFADKKAKLEFYRNLQNPKTGAFMTDDYPLFTYIGCTLNVVSHIELLSQEAGEPLRLNYPLQFLDEINTLEKIRAFLDDLSTVGRIGAKFRSPYVLPAELAANIDYLEATGLYTFSPEWKKTLRQWYYDNQDSQTGYWGPRLRGRGELLNSGDLVSTEKVVKLFVDNQGNNIHAEFPLRYTDQMFSTTLQKLAEPMPQDLDALHDWTLAINRGTKLLTRYLWNSASAANQEAARKLMEDNVRTKFTQYYIEREGAFSLYPEAEHADLDGTGETLGYLDKIGALPGKTQDKLWGPLADKITDLGVLEISGFKESDLACLKNTPGINSIRIYQADPGPGSYTSGVLGVYYPKETPVLDVMDLLPKVSRWIQATPQDMGNWVTKEDTIQELAVIDIQPVPVFKGDIPLKVVHDNKELVLIGFDVLQIPKYKVTLRVKLTDWADL